MTFAVLIHGVNREAEKKGFEDDTGRAGVVREGDDDRRKWTVTHLGSHIAQI